MSRREKEGDNLSIDIVLVVSRIFLPLFSSRLSPRPLRHVPTVRTSGLLDLVDCYGETALWLRNPGQRFLRARQKRPSRLEYLLELLAQAADWVPAVVVAKPGQQFSQL